MAEEKALGRIIISEEELQQKVAELAEAINKDYPEGELIVVGILKGCFVFLADLVRKLKADIKVHFMQVSSYGDGTQSSGNLIIKKDLNVDIEGKHLLLAEDIIDSGNTLYQLIPRLKERKPASVKVCALLSKPSRRQVEFEADYTGFEIPDEFIVGYGLDCAESYRQLPYIAVVQTEEE